jgi:uncharacterized protein (TIGR02300 family)
MIKPKWGTKRRCQHCGAAFYDLGRTPIVCPKCETEFKPEAVLKPRRARPDEKPVPKPPPRPEPAEAEEVEEAEVVEGELIEDASELGDDENDVAEVVEEDGPEPGEP